MVVTDVSMNLSPLTERGGGRLLAICSVTLDEVMVIHDVKVIDGIRGLIVAMPNRKLMDKCYYCHYKNHLRARYCNSCGRRLCDELQRESHPPNQLLTPPSARSSDYYTDVVHPISQSFRLVLEEAVLTTYKHLKSNPIKPAPKFDLDNDDDHSGTTQSPLPKTVCHPDSQEHSDGRTDL